MSDETTCGFCKDTGIAPWIMGDFVRACGYCSKGQDMAHSGYFTDLRGRTLETMPPTSPGAESR